MISRSAAQLCRRAAALRSFDHQRDFGRSGWSDSVLVCAGGVERLCLWCLDSIRSCLRRCCRCCFVITVTCCIPTTAGLASVGRVDCLIDFWLWLIVNNWRGAVWLPTVGMCHRADDVSTACVCVAAPISGCRRSDRRWHAFPTLVVGVR